MPYPLAVPLAYRNDVPGTEQSVEQAKTQLRRRLTELRRNRSDEQRQVARAAVTAHVIYALAGHRCVAAYLPLPSEPFDRDALDLLARGARVLVPAVDGAAPLNWCDYPGPVRPGAYGIDEPTGPRLGADAIAAADGVLMPALAVDRHGHRLGRGGGHYDRTLSRLMSLVGTAAMPPRIAVIYDDELISKVPADALDQPVTAVITPDAGLRAAG